MATYRTGYTPEDFRRGTVSGSSGGTSKTLAAGYRPGYSPEDFRAGTVGTTREENESILRKALHYGTLPFALPWKGAQTVASVLANTLTRGDPAAGIRVGDGSVWDEILQSEKAAQVPQVVETLAHTAARAAAPREALDPKTVSGLRELDPEGRAAFEKARPGVAGAEAAAEAIGDLPIQMATIPIPGGGRVMADPTLGIMGALGRTATLGRALPTAREVGITAGEVPTATAMARLLPISDDIGRAGAAQILSEAAGARAAASPLTAALLERPGLAKASERAIAASFLPGMALHAGEAIPETIRSYKEEGLSPDTIRSGVGGAVSGAFAALGAKHLARPGVTPIERQIENIEAGRKAGEAALKRPLEAKPIIEAPAPKDVPMEADVLPPTKRDIPMEAEPIPEREAIELPPPREVPAEVAPDIAYKIDKDAPGFDAYRRSVKSATQKALEKERSGIKSSIYEQELLGDLRAAREEFSKSANRAIDPGAVEVSLAKKLEGSKYKVDPSVKKSGSGYAVIGPRGETISDGLTKAEAEELAYFERSNERYRKTAEKMASPEEQERAAEEMDGFEYKIDPTIKKSEESVSRDIADKLKLQFPQAARIERKEGSYNVRLKDGSRVVVTPEAEIQIPSKDSVSAAAQGPGEAVASTRAAGPGSVQIPTQVAIDFAKGRLISDNVLAHEAFHHARMAIGISDKSLLNRFKDYREQAQAKLKEAGIEKPTEKQLADAVEEFAANNYAQGHGNWTKGNKDIFGRVRKHWDRLTDSVMPTQKELFRKIEAGEFADKPTAEWYRWLSKSLADYAKGVGESPSSLIASGAGPQDDPKFAKMRMEDLGRPKEEYANLKSEPVVEVQAESPARDLEILRSEMAALDRNVETGAPVPIWRLREASSLPKERFDAAIRYGTENRTVDLMRHPQESALTPEEKAGGYRFEAPELNRETGAIENRPAQAYAISLTGEAPKFKVGEDGKYEFPEREGYAPPRVERNVENLEGIAKEVSGSEKASPEVKRQMDRLLDLDRNTPQTWASLEGKAGRIAKERTLQDWVNKAKSGSTMRPESKMALEKVIANEEATHNEFIRQRREAVDRGDQAEVERIDSEMFEQAKNLAVLESIKINDLSSAGRALAAGRYVSEVTGDRLPSAILSRIIRELPHLNPLEAAALEHTFHTNPAGFADAFRQAMKPGVMDKVVEFWKAGLVSALPTQAANTFSNAAEQTVRIFETITSAQVQKMLQGKDAPRSTREAAAEWTGMRSAFGPAFKRLTSDLGKIFKLEPETLDLESGKPIEYSTGAIGGKTGRAVRVPFRLLDSMDLFFRELAVNRETHKLAYREALKEAGLNKKEAWQSYERILREISNKDTKWASLREKAADSAMESIFRDKPDATLKAAMHLRQSMSFGGDIVVPFLQTPWNIAKLTFKRSPLYLGDAIRAYRQFKKGTITAEEASDRISRPVVGSVIASFFYSVASGAMPGVSMTGGGPTDTKKRSLMLETGWQPYSFKIDLPEGESVYLPFSRFEPVSGVLSMAADTAEIDNSEIAENQYDKMVGAIVNAFVNKTFMKGLSDAAMVASRPLEMGGQYVRNLAGSAVPNIVRKGAQAIDPTLRDIRPSTKGVGGFAESAVKAVASGIPGLDKTVPARVSGTGKKIQRKGTVTGFFSPIKPTVAEDAPVERLLIEVGYVPSEPDRKLRVGSGAEVILNDDEYEVFAKGRQLASEYVASKLMNNPEFMRLPNTEDEARRGEQSKESVLKSIYNRFNKRARSEVWSRFPELRKRGKEAIAEAGKKKKFGLRDY